VNRLIAALLVALALPLSIAVLDAAPAGAGDCSWRTDAEAFAYAAVFVGRVTGYETTDAAHWSIALVVLRRRRKAAGATP
jgi:hypothetical protein